MSPYREMKLMAEASESNRLETQAKLDRVTAERDALQQRLTASDERVDALGSLVPEAELALKALNVAVSVYDVELADSARRGLRLIIAALKPAQGRNPSTCTWTEGGFSWHTGCGKEWQFTDGGFPV